MKKHFCLTIVMLVAVIISSYGQSYWFSQFTVIKPPISFEGGTYKYEIRRIGNAPLPSNISLSVSEINKGTWQQSLGYNIDPYNGQNMYIFVHWDCGLINNSIGKIHLLELNTNQEFIIDVTLTSNYGPLFCTQIYPQQQDLLYGQVGQDLQVVNCSQFCESPTSNYYNFTYQWQWAVFDPENPQVIPSVWNDVVVGGNAIKYTPPAFYDYGGRYYRRVTRYLAPSIFPGSEPEYEEKYSEPFVVKFFKHLDPGNISTQTPIITTYNSPPVIDQVPASGGLCMYNDYVYTWEKRIIGTSNWIAIGNGANCPALSPLQATTVFRRKVECNGEIKYTNELQVVFNYLSPNLEPALTYTREIEVLVPRIYDWPSADNLKIGEKMQSTKYVDGLDRTKEIINKGVATPLNDDQIWGDLIYANQYNEYGIQEKDYLPFARYGGSVDFSYTPYDDQREYYNWKFSYDKAFRLVSYDKDPFQAPVNVKSPGETWYGSSGITSYSDINSEDEKVPLISMGNNSDDMPKFIGYYGSGKLYRKVTIDEQGKKVIEYHDKSGDLILRKVQLDDFADINCVGWICTYNIYDNLNRLRITLQPEGFKKMSDLNWNFELSEVKQALYGLSFQYYYDDFGRMINKKAPDGDKIIHLFDNRNRLTFFQDGNLRAQNTKLYNVNIYDDLDRLIIMGQYELPFSDIESIVHYLNTTDPHDLTDQLLQEASANSTFKIYKRINYDEYSQSAIGFSSGFNNYDAYSVSNEIPSIKPSKKTLDKVTSTETAILGSNLFLNSTLYYNENGQLIQKLSTNIKGEIDIETYQYHWNGKMMSSDFRHKILENTAAYFSVLSRYKYDKIGRVTYVEKKYGSNAFKKIFSYNYDELGKVVRKVLDPDYSNPSTLTNGIESLDYSYNIQGKITGINKAYALKSPGYSKWNNYFGQYINYEGTADLGNSNLNGQPSGIIWNTQGDDEKRKYEYSYDNAGRLIKADYSENRNGSWLKDKTDFSVYGMTNGVINYDLNGNIQSMIHKGILIGNADIFEIDNLDYKYYANSNRLRSVTDNAHLPINSNGISGDFTDNGNTSDDYEYDLNGNLIIDLNKGIKNDPNGIRSGLGTTGIQYNVLNKPERIYVENKGVYTFLYTIDGDKLQQSFESFQTGETTTTTFINGFVYKETSSSSVPKLEIINFEEGRIRIINPFNEGFVTSAGSISLKTVLGSIDLPVGTNQLKNGVFDFFIRDYQNSVRMILTEETHKTINTCTMELDNAAVEEALFGQQSAGLNEVQLTRFPTANIPGLAASNNFQGYASKLSKSTYKVGPNYLMKVMAGDLISASVNYYYVGSTNNSGSTTIFNDIISSLFGAISTNSSAPSLAKAGTDFYSSQYSGLPSFFEGIAPNNGATDNIPLAYLRILFFDERFNYVGTGNEPLRRVSTSGNDANPLVLQDIKAPKNGYAFVYISNESDISVYFDKFIVSHDRGRLIEENHYYPYGLKIASISSKKMPDDEGREGGIKNSRKFNDKELLEEADLQLYDYGFRFYDPQIGRFIQLDPLTYDFETMTPYQYASCDPVTKIDIDGLEGRQVVGSMSDIPLGENYEHRTKWHPTKIPSYITNAVYFEKVGPPPPVFSEAQPGAINQEVLMKQLIGAVQARDKKFPMQAPSYMRSYCAYCQTASEKEAEKQKLKDEFYKIGKDENGDDLPVTKLEKKASQVWDRIETPVTATTLVCGAGEIFMARRLIYNMIANLGNQGERWAFRALTEADAISVNAGNGIFAKAPSGTWTLEEHLIKGSRSGAWSNNPWIATSLRQDVAASFESGNGLVKIDLWKLPSRSMQKGWLSLPRSSLGYHFSIWQQEVSIYRYIPQSAIKVIR